MPEVARFSEPEVTSQTVGQVMVVYSRHATEDQLKKGKPGWPQEVYDKVKEFLPTILAIDGIRPGFTIPAMNLVVPVDDLSPFPKGFRVIGADSATVYDVSDNENEPVEREQWKLFVNAVTEYNQAFTKQGPTETFAVEIARQFSIEEGLVSLGEIALLTKIIRRLIKNKKSEDILRPSKLESRRRFLKLASISIAGSAVAALNYGRKEAYRWGMDQIQETYGTPNLPQALVHLTKPWFYDNEWLKARNGKVGLSVLHQLSQKGQSEMKAAIIFGRGHVVSSADPGLKEGETLDQAKVRLLKVMRDEFQDIVNINQKAENPVPPEIMAIALREFFANYDVYLHAPGPTNPNTDFSWLKWHQGIEIPEIVNAINEVLQLKNH